MRSFVTTMFTDASNGWNETTFMAMYFWGFQFCNFSGALKPLLTYAVTFFLQNSQFWLLCFRSKHHFKDCPKIKITTVLLLQEYQYEKTVL
jgi:hypothetical protein